MPHMPVAVRINRDTKVTTPTEELKTAGKAVIDAQADPAIRAALELLGDHSILAMAKLLADAIAESGADDAPGYLDIDTNDGPVVIVHVGKYKITEDGIDENSGAERWQIQDDPGSFSELAGSFSDAYRLALDMRPGAS